MSSRTRQHRPARLLHTPGQGKSGPAAPVCPESAFSVLRPAGLRSPQCRACFRGAPQCRVSRAMRCLTMCSGGPGGAGAGSVGAALGPGRQLVPTLTINTERVPVGERSVRAGRCCPGGGCGAGGGSLAPGTGGRCLQEAAEARASWPPSPGPHRCRDREPPERDSRDTPEKPALGPAPRAGAEARLSPSLFPPAAPLAHPGPGVLRHQGAGLGLARPGHVATNT